ncbi:MAG: hypothetical protein HYV33_00995 [Candidatus Kerfeldbacteria bacterium]|nr:hypothetical protein [Candidatus Kerfeldbacteria bacterium]
MSFFLQFVIKSILTLLTRRSLSYAGMTAVGCAVTLGLITPSGPTMAWLGFGLDDLLFIISGIMYFFLIYIMGFFATVGAKLLVYTSSFSGFTDKPIIIESWSLVRDISNMFFIAILLLIAFGTLFKIEAYSWKKLLPKMLLAAILINYSRAICGVIVDAAQVIMLTFVAAIAPAATQGIVTAFQLSKLLSTDDALKDVQSTESASGVNVESSGTTLESNRLLAIAAAGLMLAVLVVVELVYVVVLVGRLVFIWFLTVLSPLAFACSVLPATEKYYRQWWEMFGRYVMVGPLVMFYLWLAMFIAAKTGGELGKTANPNIDSIIPADVQISQLSKSGALNVNTITGFIISAMMLMAGLKMAQDNSSELGSITSQASSFGKFIAKAPLRYGLKPAAGVVNDRMYEKWGLDLNIPRQFELLQHQRKEIQNRRVMQGRIKAGKAAQQGNFVKGWLGAADFQYEQYMPLLGVQGLMYGAGGDWRKSQLGRLLVGRFGQGIAEGDLTEKEAAHTAAQETVKTKRTTLEENFTTVEEKRKRVQQLTDQIEDAETHHETAGWDMTEGSSDRTLLEQVKNQKEKERDQAYADGRHGDGDRIDSEIKLIDQALVQKTGRINLDVSLGGTMRQALDKRAADLKKDRTQWGSKNDNYNGRNITSPAVLKSVIEEQLKVDQAIADKAKKALETAQKRAKAWAPVMDFEGLAKQQALLAEAQKEFHGETNEDKLVAFFQEKMHEKNGTHALAGLAQATKVGHLNEILKAEGLEVSVKGMRDLAKRIQIQTKISEEAVMSAMNDISNSARDAGHWIFAEAVGFKNGKYQWRNDDERYERVYTESAKRGPQALAKNTHLGAFEYYKDGKTGEYMQKIFYPIARVLAEGMPKLGDSANKGYLNAQQGEGWFHRQPEIRDFLRELVQTIHSGNSAVLQQAVSAMDAWGNASIKRTKGILQDSIKQGVGPIS